MNSKRSGWILFWVISVVLVVLFVNDINSDDQLVDWAWYFIPMYLSAQIGNRRSCYFLAGIISYLILVGFYIEPIGPTGIDRHIALTGRLIGVSAIWVMALLIVHQKDVEKKLKKAEDELIDQKTKLAHMVRVSTMDHLAASLTQELTQPLGAILRNAEAAELFLQGENPDLKEIRAILMDIRKDDQRAGSVIERMRPLLKYRSLELTSVDLIKLLTETVALTESDARLRQVRVDLQLPAKLPMVRGDRIHLQQVLLNLMLNGMDAMTDVEPKERLLIVRAGLVKDGVAEVSVTDCGTGISPEKMKRLFEPFFTSKPDGLGMGLAISKNLIEAHGGKIWGENNPARGAVFKFILTAANE